MSLDGKIVSWVKEKFKADLRKPDQRARAIANAVKAYLKNVSAPFTPGEATYDPLESLAFRFRDLGLDTTEIYKEAYAQNPSDTRLLKSIVKHLLLKDDTSKDAIEYFRKIADLEEDNFPYLKRLVDAHKARGDPYPLMYAYERIIDRFESLIGQRKDPDAPPIPAINWKFATKLYEDSIVEVVSLYVDAGRADERAMKIYHEVLKRDLETVAMLKLMVDHYLQQDSYSEEAIDVYEHYLAYEPSDERLQLTLSDAYLGKGRTHEALSILESLYERSKNRQTILERLVNYFYDNREISDHSVRYLKDYLRVKPSDRKILLAVADFFAAQNSLQPDAIEFYKNALGITKDRVKFLSLLGKYHVEQKLWSDAIEWYQLFQKEAGNVPEVIVPLASTFSELNRLDSPAIAAYQNAISLGCKSKRVYSLLSQHYYVTKNLDAVAIDCFRQCLVLDPSDFYARLGLCVHYLRQKSYAHAFSEIVVVLDDPAVDPEAFDFAAIALSRCDQPDAIEQVSTLSPNLQVTLLEKTYAQDASDRGILARLSELYRQQGKLDSRAERVYEAALEADPDNVNWLSLLSRISHKRGDKDKSHAYDRRLYRIVKARFILVDPAKRDHTLHAFAKEVCARLAEYYLETGKPSVEAEEVFWHAYGEGMRTAALLLKLAEIARERGDTSSQAVEIYEQALPLAEDKTPFEDILFKAYIDRQKTKPVFDYCIKRLEEDPRDNRVLDLLIRCLEQCQEIDPKSAAALARIHEQDPANNTLNLALALAFAMQEKYDAESLPVLLRALSFRPDDVHLLTAIAHCYEAVGAFEKSIGVYRRISAILPDDSTVLIRLAHAFAKARRLDEQALNVVERVLRIARDEPELEAYHCKLLFALGNKERALEALDHLSAKSPEILSDLIRHLESLKPSPTWSPELSIRLAFLYIEDGRSEEALLELGTVVPQYARYCGDLIEGYTRIIRKDPRHVRARVERGVIHKLIGNFDDAVKDIESVLTRDPENTNILYELAEVYAAQLSHTRDLDISLVHKAGKIYFDIGELDKAIMMFQKILQKDRFSPEATLYLAKSFHRKQSLDLAFQYYRRLDKSAEIKELLYSLAEDFYSHGQIFRAIETYNEIMAEDITFRDVAARINELNDELQKSSYTDRQMMMIKGELSARAQQRFDLIEEIGRGTMGIIYKAYDKELDETVALKVLPERFSTDQAALERFKLEAKSARRLTHPYIVRIFDIGEEAGRKHLSMEFVEGGDLKRLLAQTKAIASAEALRLALQIASALAYAHQMGVLHRDIKPANILLTPQNDVKLTDFGIAAVITEVQSAAAEIIIGTPLYMSPEQSEGKPCSPASDVYSLGVVIYEMLTGKPPFTAGNIAYHHIHTEPPAMENVPPDISRIVMKSLEKNPTARYATMDELIADMTGVLPSGA
jgi:tetratricopeptide (TPR) repeat protein